ncbi:hypothetical protein AA0483_1446 [Acetobacter syzygii NRIC 0483]|nr:hypothetical protein AA0483_1446 [Acetobacter syzygii NRIC 0483]
MVWWQVLFWQGQRVCQRLRAPLMRGVRVCSMCLPWWGAQPPPGRWLCWTPAMGAKTLVP